MSWTKHEDWIPFQNAAAQVIFWKQDLIKIQNSLRVLEQMGVPNNDPGYLLTIKEVEVSQKGLDLALFKYKRAFRRLTESDKTIWNIS